MINKYILASAAAASLLMVGCSGGGDSTTTTDASATGYVVDSAVQNLDYDCVADNDMDKKTGANGAFTCRNMNQVRFRIGELVLGEISGLPQDGYVLPQDIAGVNREAVTDTKVTAMAQLLQSLDEDGDLTNGIQIPEETKALFDNEHFTEANLEHYRSQASVALRTETEAQEHLRETMRNMTAGGNGTGVDLSQYPLSNLTDAQKYTIAYMWNEEKLAKDLYIELNLIYPTQQLENIGTRSEPMHQALVEDLVERYDLNITNLVDYKENYSEEELRAFASGEFGVQEIQDLYDTLYAEGKASQQAALEVGCKVEVTDVEDLLEEIAIAEEVDAQDLIAVWNVLLSGSYNHYWAFDTGLKNMGIADGCCSLGDAYCHPEYPQNEKGGNSQ